MGTCGVQGPGPSLIDSEGYLWDNVEQVAMHAKAEHVRIELKAQIDRAIAFGVPLSHLDTHMGAVMARPDLVEVYVALGLEYNLPVLFMSQMDEPMRKEYPALADRFDSALIKLKSNSFRCSTIFFNSTAVTFPNNASSSILTRSHR